MCFSVEVEKELKKLAYQFKAKKSKEDFDHFYELKAHEKDGEWLKQQLGLKRKPASSPFKEADPEGRIFPGTFTTVIVEEDGERLLKPMRYRLRPYKSKEEIPTKFNVYNARFDSLESRQTWRRLFMKKHGLFPFKRFFEWVDYKGARRLIKFSPENHELMWAPCLWDYWESKDGSLGFYSFALVTDDPPWEIQNMGHDRCPIFLKEECIGDWLSPAGKSKHEIKQLLKQKEDVRYRYEWVEPETETRQTSFSLN
ncbi:MAG TPA: SOS response-associated peptidase family protein [Bacteriovoracaceae bacterium]|nr:SOS response-associated peptidase family protein [Bacteriovoracaceae bacterium]